MKKNVRTLTLVFALLIFCLGFASCAEEAKKTEAELPALTIQTSTVEEAIAKEGLWKDALYVKKTALGEGKTKFLFTVTADGKSVEFIISTDRETLAEALLSLGLLEGEDSSYGLYVKKVNGITADYDADQSWWGLNVNGESSMAGASGVTVENNARYEFVYSK